MEHFCEGSGFEDLTSGLVLTAMKAVHSKMLHAATNGTKDVHDQPLTARNSGKVLAMLGRLTAPRAMVLKAPPFLRPSAEAFCSIVQRF